MPDAVSRNPWWKSAAYVAQVVAATGLQPGVAQRFLWLLQWGESRGIPLVLIEGRRTSERQAWLYAQGRTRPGNIVTNARPGESFHEVGLAFDLDMPRSRERRVAAEAKLIGLRWGGDWKVPDRPHFEFRP